MNDDDRLDRLAARIDAVNTRIDHLVGRVSTHGPVTRQEFKLLRAEVETLKRESLEWRKRRRDLRQTLREIEMRYEEQHAVTQRTWQTTIKASGSTPVEAVSRLMEDDLAALVSEAIFLRPQRATPTVVAGAMVQGQFKAARATAPVTGWIAETTVKTTERPPAV